jgi:5'-nucleotidase
LTNDDGILAPGLAAMYRALAPLGRVTVAAPDSAQSASAHAITVAAALAVQRIHVHNEFHGWSIGGRPADCVKLAVHELAEPPRPDLVVSGINDGANVSINVLYSGTVAAAAEGALLGFPAVAVSLQRGAESDFDRAASIARRIIDALLADGISPGSLVNVNIPALQPGCPKGVRVATQAVQVMEDHYERRDSPDGTRQYFLGGDFGEPAGDRETDLHALSKGYAVVTPLQVDLTDQSRLKSLEGVEWPDFS